VIGGVRRAVGEPVEQPGVDGTEQRVTGFRARPQTRNVLEHPFDLGRGEVGIEHQPVRPWIKARCRSATSSAQRGAVRRSCHTIARCNGFPLPRSHTQTVSRWLVMPMAVGTTRDWPSASRAASTVRRKMSSAVVLHFTRRRIVLRQLTVAAAEHAPVRPDDQSRGTSRALIQGENGVHQANIRRKRGFTWPRS